MTARRYGGPGAQGEAGTAAPRGRIDLRIDASAPVGTGPRSVALDNLPVMGASNPPA